MQIFKAYLFILAVMYACSASAIDIGPLEVALQFDARWVAIDSPYVSFTNGGLGLLRYDEQHDGLRLGHLMAALSGPLTDTVRANLTLNATGDHDAHVIDVTEAYLEWRPYPQTNWRWRTRVGAFYPSISLENRAAGWQSAYSLSTSAINTWIGEEVRAIGVEQSLTLTHANSARNFDIGLVGGVFKWNDPMGVLLFQRGWALHDRQTALFGGLPRPFATSAEDKTIEFFRELDGRIGYYVGAEYKYGEQHTVRVLHYDNRGDPSITSGKESAWLSRFNSLGWRYEAPSNTTFIIQGLKGDTAVGPSVDGRGQFILDYWSYFALVSQQVSAHHITIRYDRLHTQSERGANIFDSAQTAIAWTCAYLWDFDNHWQFAAEALRISGSLQQRVLMGLTPDAIERSWQLAARYSL